MMNSAASHSCFFTHVLALRCEARQTHVASTPCAQFLQARSHRAGASAVRHRPPNSTSSSAAPPRTPTTALTAISCQRGQILTCSVARLLPGLGPPPPAPTRISKRWLCPTELITVKSKESLVGNDPIIPWTCGVWVAFLQLFFVLYDLALYF